MIYNYLGKVSRETGKCLVVPREVGRLGERGFSLVKMFLRNNKKEEILDFLYKMIYICTIER